MMISRSRPAARRGIPGRPLVALVTSRVAQLWDLGWALAGAVPVRLKILGIALGMVGLLSFTILVTLWFTLPDVIKEAQTPEHLFFLVSRDLIYVTAATSLIGIVSAYLLTLVLTRPIMDLVAVVRRVQGGDMTRTARIWANDEIGQLARVFNTMLESLRASQAQLETSHREVLRQNRELAQLSDELRQKEQLRAQLLEKVISAQEEERKRIARELHDETSQTLTSLVIGLKVLEGLTDPRQVRAQVAELREMAASTLGAVHGLALELRPSVLDDLGLVAALQRHVEAQARKYGLEVDFQASGLDGVRLPSETETAVYRVIQEALTNVARHARATSASVILERRGEMLVAIVEDDGQGFAVEDMLSREHSLGLHGMRERSILVGGKLTIESTPGRGTTVFIQAPLASSGLAPPVPA